MSNSYYNHTTYPTPNSPGSSAALRAELSAITDGFDLLPTLAGNGYKVAMINATGTAMVASSALQSLAITGSTIDSTPIGATTRAAGNFTNLSVNGTAGLGTAVTIGGGTINNTIIGGTTPVAGFFTTLSATSGLTGNVTGNLTGNVTGNVTGNLTGNVTGNVTATSGTSQFNNVTINGQLDMDAGSSATIINLPNPTNNGDAANKAYVDTQDALKLSLTGGTMSGAIAMGTNRVTGMGDPVNAQDAATKIYVDNSVQGLDAKASCRVATTANITLSGTQTIDGVAVIAGDRVLVKDQSTQAENGIYVVAAGAWSRSADANTWDELVHAYSFVESGTAGANNGYVCTVSAGGTLGSTAVTWVQFSGAGQVIPGTGMTKTGNTLNVNTASSSRIVAGADELDLATTGVVAGTYRSITVDQWGRATGGTNPTTISGYGITDAYTKTEVDTALALKLNLSGGTMSGALAMGSNKITGMADPTSNQDAATKFYVDSILGSATSAAASASAAATSATNAANSATSASNSATAAANSATAAANSYDEFDDRYLGSKTSDPTVDNDGNPLLTGALYFNSSAGVMKVYSGSAWLAAYIPAAGYLALSGGTMTGDITFAGTQTWPTFNQNTTGNAATATALQTARTINGVSFDGTANITVADSTKLPLAGGTMTGTITFAAGQTISGYLTTSDAASTYQTISGMSNYLALAGGAMTGDLTLNAQADLRFADADSSNWVAFQAPATVAANVTWTLPAADGTANQVLSTNGSGTLSWSTIASLTGTTQSTTPFLTALGASAGNGTGTGTYNVAIGVNALDSFTTGASNVAIGFDAGTGLTTGNQNVAVGAEALVSTQTHTGNVAIGYRALKVNTANSNVAIGASTGIANTTGNNNVFVGFNAAAANTTGSYNVALGRGALGSVQTTDNHIAIGYSSLSGVTSGAGNIGIGYQAAATGTGNLTTGSNNIIIGNNATTSSATVSNEATWGNSSITSNRFWGDLKMGGSSAGTSGQALLSAGAGVSPTWGTLGVGAGGTGATTLTGVLKGNGTSAFTAATAGIDFVAPDTATTFTAIQTFSGGTTSKAIQLLNAGETVNLAGAASGALTIALSLGAVHFYSSNATSNWTIDFRYGTSSPTLPTVLLAGQSMTVAVLAKQGATAYYNTSISITGATSVTTIWQGGSAPTAGNANSTDIYVYTIINTGGNNFTVFASQTKFA